MADATVPPNTSTQNGTGEPAQVIPFTPRSAQAEAPDPIGSLPFVRTLPEPSPDRAGRYFWSPPLEGLDTIAANRRGYAYAFACIRAMAATGFVPLLAVIERDMGEAEDDEDAAIRAGFFEVFGGIATMVAEAGDGDLGWLEERYRERAAKVDAMLAETRAGSPDEPPPAA